MSRDSMQPNAVELSLFAHRLAAICEEMGAVLRRSAISPNIRDREDFSCALFDADGVLVAQAAHIPVHLGSMAFAMRDVIDRFHWRVGDVVVFNDPMLGGTHLPDVTMVMPLFIDGLLSGFAAARAHHADIGGRVPGSMGVERQLSDEGLIISPRYWFEGGVEQPELPALILERVREPAERMGDLAAQRAACQLALERMQAFEHSSLRSMVAELIRISEAYGHAAVAAIPDGEYRFEDALEDDGFGSGPLPIRVAIRIAGERAEVDFAGSAGRSQGPLNCPIAVTAAAVYYAFRCLMPASTPQCAAIFHPISIAVDPDSLLRAGANAPVAAGNVETSQRVVDVVLGALAAALPERIPAAAQGTMNNVIFGGRTEGSDGAVRDWVYYETLAGGMGAHAEGNGASALQCHMTNTRNSSIEVLEMHYPLRITTYAVRDNSGGVGHFRGGHGLVREWQVLEACHLSLLTERRASAPYGLQGGNSGARGINRLLRNGCWSELPAKGSVRLEQGDIVRIETPGGGGFGKGE